MKIGRSQKYILENMKYWNQVNKGSLEELLNGYVLRRSRSEL